MLGVLGLIGLLVAIGCGVLSSYNFVMVFRDSELRKFVWATKPSTFVFLVLFPVVCLVWGSSWLYSSRCFWKQRWKLAIVMFAIGAASLFAMVNLPVRP